MAPPSELPDWERLLAAERHLQALLPDAVLVGGTAAILHADHRRSLDGDHVLEDLRERFDEVLSALEAAAGWKTSRVQRPVAILGQLDGIMTGIRQLRRTRSGAFVDFDGIYAQDSTSPLAEVIERLAAASPSDRAEVELRDYKGLVAPWNSWEHLAERGRHWAAVLAGSLLRGENP